MLIMFNMVDMMDNFNQYVLSILIQVSSMDSLLFPILFQKQAFYLLTTFFLILLLYYLKQYFNGGVFQIPKKLDLTGKTLIITGGNAGIGKCTLIQMAKLNCSIIIGARDQHKSQECIKEVKKLTNNQNLEYIHLDLASKASIEEFCSSVKFDKIDYLVNNAGVFGFKERTLTADGFEMHFGTNHLGHFYLTYLLWSKIKRSEYFRIITIASLAHKRIMGMLFEPKMDFSNVNFEKDYHLDLAYSRSKLANVLFTSALADKINSKSGRTACVHPGVVRTELLRQIDKGIIWIGLKLVYFIHVFFTKTPQQGNQTTMYTLLSESVENGCYYADCKKDQMSSQVTSFNKSKLWEESQRLLGITFDI